MTVNEMLTLSHIFLGVTIVLLIATVSVFFLLDVKKAWRILSGRRFTATDAKKQAGGKVIHKSSTDSLIKKEIESRKLAIDSRELTEVLNVEESSNNQDIKEDTTEVLGEDALTCVLDSRNIVVDMTFIHTDVTL